MQVEGKLEDDSGLAQCYSMGLLQAEQGSKVVYVLPTRLHHKYYEHVLNRKAVFPEKYSSLEALVWDAITHFSRRALSGVEPKLGPGLLHRPLEATFQDELYRGIYKALGGIFTTSEWSGEGSRGRIDFVVTAGDERWGIECVRNGNNMGEHVRRFLPGGVYYPWVSGGSLQSYVLLDFRFDEPSDYCPSPSHPAPDRQADCYRVDYEHPWIYYIVFSTDCSSVKVLDHEGCAVKEEFEILN